MNKLIFFIFIFAAQFSFSSDLVCYPASNLKYNYKMTPKFMKEKFCVDPDSNFLINQSCSKSGHCLAMKRQKLPQEVVKNRPEIGSPGHRVCQALKATPIIVKYKTNGANWKETSICLFGDDSFVNVDYMMKYNIATD